MKINQAQRHTSTLRDLVAGAATGVVLTSIVGVGSEPASATYHSPWSRQNVYDMGATGVGEAYDSTGTHSVWSDDNTWNEAGADCSGFVNKVWAVPYYKSIGTDYHGPYNTSSWYYAPFVDGAVNINLTDTRTRLSDVWVFRRADGTGHMGVFAAAVADANGQWKVMDAANSTVGIRTTPKPNSYFLQHYEGSVLVYESKRFKRADW